ncbi:regucalcin [Aplysia californica]|uniref:Regucalcin n=1 Tax=Aplysia californica TaxID=6500 RepID=A0ABM1A2K4_APLCA|nr:regucalcin [Aplysia californica]
MSSPKVEAVLKNCFSTCGEGPHWDVASQSLYYVDIVAGGVGCWNSVTGEKKQAKLDGQVTFVIPCDRGGCVIGHNQNVSHFDLDTSALTKLVSVEEGLETRFNDAKCDASGRLWAGTMGHEGDIPGVVKLGLGSLYSLSTDHNIKKHVGGIDISNGMDWTDDNSIMYYIDSIPRKVYAFDFDMAGGTLSNQRTVVEFGEGTMETYGLPDGMCIDCEGKIWVACFSASRVYRFDPETGKTLQEVKLPATNITSVCFGGKNLDELYVTCSRHNIKDEASQPLAGSVFRVTELGVKGRAPNNFKG